MVEKEMPKGTLFAGVNRPEDSYENAEIRADAVLGKFRSAAKNDADVIEAFKKRFNSLKQGSLAEYEAFGKSVEDAKALISDPVLSLRIKLDALRVMQVIKDAAVKLREAGNEDPTNEDLCGAIDKMTVLGENRVPYNPAPRIDEGTKVAARVSMKVQELEFYIKVVDALIAKYGYPAPPPNHAGLAGPYE